MVNLIIKFLVYAATVSVLYGALAYLHSRDNTSKDPEQDDTNYVVRVTRALTMVYGTMFWMGTGLLVFWSILMLRGKGGNLTVGHLGFGAGTAALGFFVAVLASRWRITVHGDQMAIHRLFRRPQSVAFTEIEKVIEQKKKTRMGISSRVVLYKNQKKLIAVDGLSENYDRFCKTLKEAGKFVEEKL